MSRSTVLALVVGVVVVGALATMTGFISFTADPAGEQLPAPTEPQSLCDYLEHLINPGPHPARDLTPTAVLTDPRLGDPTTTSTAVEPTDVEPPVVGAPGSSSVDGPGPNGAAATYILAQDGLITTIDDPVEIPAEIADDYRVFTTELYRLVFEEPGSDLSPSPESLVAAARLDTHLAGCKPA